MDGEQIPSIVSKVGSGSDVGEETVAVVSPESFGVRVLKPGAGMNDGASMFKGFPDASSSNEGSVIGGAGKGFVVKGYSKAEFPDGGLGGRPSCRLFARGRIPLAFPP